MARTRDIFRTTLLAALAACVAWSPGEELITNGSFSEGGRGWDHLSFGTGGGSIYFGDFATLVAYSGMYYDDYGNWWYGDGYSTLLQWVERVPANLLHTVSLRYREYLWRANFGVNLIFEDGSSQWVPPYSGEYGDDGWFHISYPLSLSTKRVRGVSLDANAMGGYSDGYASIDIDDVSLQTSYSRPMDFQNADFEEHPLTSGWVMDVPGWTYRRQADVGTHFGGGGFHFDWVPSGQKVLFVNWWDAPVSQQIGRVFEVGKRYRLKTVAGHAHQELRRNRGRVELRASDGPIDFEGRFVSSSVVRSRHVAGKDPQMGDLHLIPRGWIPVELEVAPQAGDPIVGKRIGVSFVTEPYSEGPVHWDNLRLEVENLPYTLTGRIRLEDFDPSKVGGTRVWIDVVGQATETVEVVLASDGSFSARMGTKGPAKAYAKASHWLRKELGSFTMGAGNSASLPPRNLVNGDCDGDNAVTVFDYNVLSDAFDSTPGSPRWNPNADLDGDGAVTVFDYNVVSDNFDRVGD